MSSEQNVRVVPSAAIPGGEVSVECSGYDTSNLRECRVTFEGTPGQMVGAAPWRVLAVVPETLEGGGEVKLVLESGDGVSTVPATVIVGRKLAEDLHMVANPAVDPDDGSVYVTRSGTRGQRMPVSLFRIDPGGELTAVTGEITNPTGIAFDSLGQMYVTSRMDGTVYRVTPFHEVVPFARDLGVATGLAFDRDGRASVFFKGLGRPNGLAFGSDGNLYVAASYKGRRGVVRISADGSDAG